jgi:hypothetical protein
VTQPTNFLRAIFFFQDNEASAGWSETLYLQGSNLNTAFQSAYAIAQLRRAFLPTQFQIVWIRVDNIFQPRQYTAGTAGINGPLPGQYTAAAVLPADVRLLSAQIGAGPAQINRCFLGGISEADVSFQQFAPSKTWLDLFTPWAQALTNQANWSVYNRSIPYGSIRYQIQTIFPTPGRGNTINTANTTAISVGSIVRIVAPAAQIQGAQGYKIVTGIDPNTSFTIGGANAVGQLVGGAQAYFSVVNPTMNTIIGVRYERLTNRRSGRPFGQQVGRRQNRIPLRA